VQGKVVGGAALLLSDVFMSSWLLIFLKVCNNSMSNCAGQEKSKNPKIKKLHFLPKESGRQYGSTARYGTVPTQCF
jgi:hypothetical protein